MENMDNFCERFDALQQQTEQLKHQTQTLEAHTHTVERRLRWWRGIACGVVMLSLLSLALPSGKAADAPGRGMAERMATLEQKLAAMDFNDAANEVVIIGANLRIVNGLGATETTNGLGNLIVGYNELRPIGTNDRTGSHNLVVGQRHNFSSFGGLVVSFQNEISGAFASVSGGDGNIASGRFSSISGGGGNTASGLAASINGGQNNTASSNVSSVSGGVVNTANGNNAWVGGGSHNIANDGSSSVSGGDFNVSSGFNASVSGGTNNTASGDFSSVSGGRNRTAPALFNWAAGALFSDQ